MAPSAGELCQVRPQRPVLAPLALLAIIDISILSLSRSVEWPDDHPLLVVSLRPIRRLSQAVT